MSKEAMKLALEALENSVDLVSHEARNAEELYGKYPSRLARIRGLVAFEVAHEKAIAALREALAEQPAQQEPVFWTRKQWGMDREFCEKPFTTDWEPLYTSPPAQRTWVGLDNDDLVWIYSNSDNVGQAISNTEAKLKEKNT